VFGPSPVLPALPFDVRFPVHGSFLNFSFFFWRFQARGYRSWRGLFFALLSAVLREVLGVSQQIGLASKALRSWGNPYSPPSHITMPYLAFFSFFLIFNVGLRVRRSFSFVTLTFADADHSRPCSFRFVVFLSGKFPLGTRKIPFPASFPNSFRCRLQFPAAEKAPGGLPLPLGDGTKAPQDDGYSLAFFP